MRAPPPPDPGRDHPLLGQRGQVSVWRWKTQWEPSSKHHQGLANSTRPGRGATESPDAAPGGGAGANQPEPNGGLHVNPQRKAFLPPPAPSADGQRPGRAQLRGGGTRGSAPPAEAPQCAARSGDPASVQREARPTRSPPTPLHPASPLRRPLPPSGLENDSSRDIGSLWADLDARRRLPGDWPSMQRFRRRDPRRYRQKSSPRGRPLVPVSELFKWR